MRPSALTLERLEFSRIRVESNPDYPLPDDQSGQQLSFSFNGVNFRRTAQLRFPTDEAADPKHFFCKFGFRVAKEDQKDKVIPYEIDVEVVAFFTYLDDSLKGADRFRGVRLTAYQMLYGALREMISNLTARSTFGMMQLPSADFREAARVDSEADEKRRQVRLSKLERSKASESADDVDATVAKKKPPRKRIPKKVPAEK